MKINSTAALSLKAWRVRPPPSPPTPPPPLASSPPSAVLGREAWPPPTSAAAAEDEPRFGLPFGGGAAKRLLDRLLMQKSDAVNLVSASSNAATATGRKEESREGDERATRLYT